MSDLTVLSSSLDNQVKKSTQSIQQALKKMYADVQETVDSLTIQLQDEIRPLLEDTLILNERSMRFSYDSPITESNRLFCALLIPAFNVKANDVAPTYDLSIDLTWHFCMYFQYSPRLMTALISETLNQKFVGLKKTYGVNVVNWPPRGIRQSVIMDTIKRTNMVDHFGTIRSVVVDNSH